MVGLGHVRRIEPDRVVLAVGTIPVTPGHLHVHCASRGLPLDPPRPVFADDLVTVQCITRMSPARVDASRLHVMSDIASFADPDRPADLQGRLFEAAGPALARLDQWGAAASAAERRLIWDPAAT